MSVGEPIEVGAVQAPSALLCRATLGASAAVAIWGALILVGIWVIWDFGATKGAEAAAPVEWPGETQLVPVPGRSTLVMFVHPRCPCTRASIDELNIVMNANRDNAHAVIVFMASPGVAEELSDGAYWMRAGEIPHAVRVVDVDGREAERFDARTSGQLIVYDADGVRRFEGGITESRGHAGDNAGRRSVLEVLAEQAVDGARHAVFGCSLQGERRSARP